MIDDHDDDLSAFPDIGSALRAAADVGEGVVLGAVLGAVPPVRAGGRRASRAQVEEFPRAEDVVQRAFETIPSRQRQNLPEITRQALDSVDDGRPRAELAGSRPDISRQIADAPALRAAPATLSPRERERLVMRVQWQMSVAEAGPVERSTVDGPKRLPEHLAAA